MAQSSEPQSGVFLFKLIKAWWARLAAERVVLIAGGLIDLVLVLLGRVSIVEGLFGFGVFAILVALRPGRTEMEDQVASVALKLEDRQVTALGNFAEILEDAAIVIDERGLIVHANPAARHQFAPAEDGEPLVFSLRHPALLGEIEMARREGGMRVIEFQQPVPAETYFRATVAPVPIEPVAEGTRQRQLCLLVMRNLSEQRRTDRMRADFVANASHELRTPLTALIGFIETLQGPAARDEAARAKFLGIMRSQADRMARLIEDLLSLSRIERLQNVRPTGEVDLAMVIREVAESLRQQAKDAGLEFVIEVTEQAIIAGQREEIFEVFENLFDNAIKYGAKGKTIEVSLAALPDGGPFAFRAKVTDHGEGVLAEHVPRLTERFYRVDAESSRKKKGTGLGLAIVKHIMARHNGTLQISSRPGEGTSVELLFSA